MIAVTRLNGDHIVVNAGMIESIEATPDTLISLSTGRKLMVRESTEMIVDRVVAYYQRIGLSSLQPPMPVQENDDSDT